MAIEITYSSGETKRIVPNAFAQVASKRRFGLEAVKANDPEAILFVLFVADVGPRAAASDAAAFDAWLETVESYTSEDATPDPTTEATETPSASSPDSQ